MSGPNHSGPTARQQALIRALKSRMSPDHYNQAVTAVLGRNSFDGRYEHPLTKARASALIDLLQSYAANFDR